MVLLLAFSLQDKVEKYGAYVGLAAFLGLALLSLLYFAQARELKRLRDWAGRAPERQQELEARVVAQAEEALRMPEPAGRSRTVGPAQPVAKPAPAAPVPGPAADNGRQAGTPAPIPLGPRPATAVAAAAARASAAPQPAAVAAPEAPAEAAATSAGAVAPAQAGDGPPAAPERPERVTPPPTPEPEPEPERTANNVPAEPAIPRATPRPQPRPAPAAAPLRASTTRSASPPAARRRPETNGGSSRTARITALTVAGVVVLVAAVFGATQIFGGDDAAPPPNATVEPGGTPGGESPPANTGQSAAAARPDTVVAILNGTPTEGLAKQLRDKLLAKNYSDQQGMIRTGNNVDQQRQDSVVLYADGKRRQARDVAQILGISSIEQMDPETQALADSTGSGSVDVGVIAGADQSP